LLRAESDTCAASAGGAKSRIAAIRIYELRDLTTRTPWAAAGAPRTASIRTSRLAAIGLARIASYHGADAEAERETSAPLSVNPAFIPRDHLVDEAIQAAVVADDFAPFERLLDVLSRTVDDQRGREGDAEPPRPDPIVK
jgi:uncharacterized protein YdiU (UPF0061 family)